MMYGDGYYGAIIKINKVLKICHDLDIDTVAGPVMSGAIIAMGCFLQSGNKNIKNPINAILLEKKGYCRRKHGSGPKIFGRHGINRILIVDDCICSGYAVIDAIQRTYNSFTSVNIIGCMFMSIPGGKKAIRIVKNCYPHLRFFSLYTGEIEITNGKEKI